MTFPREGGGGVLECLNMCSKAAVTLGPNRPYDGQQMERGILNEEEVEPTKQKKKEPPALKIKSIYKCILNKYYLNS